MAERKFFNHSIEQQLIERKKDRERKRAEYRAKRAAIEESYRPELERRAAVSKLAELLATQVTPSKRQAEERFEVSLDTIDKKLTIQSLTSKEEKFEISLEEIDKKLFLHKLNNKKGE